ncbi:hypothetical protein F4780DRAFT_790764 [Xylariomycetidae sp. FL0641]|nr:hypothetical protein F4780DRAFT_790764 [Xylariomycetidae sp. FL0641]
MWTPKSIGVVAALTLAPIVSSAPTSNHGNYSLVQPMFKTLDLGSIKPLGWFKDQMELESAGLGGNMFEWYRFVHDSEWIGGDTEYSSLNEASPYWFNGVVPLAFGLGDERIIEQVKYYLDYILDHQQPDGWIGFEKTKATRGLWARCLVLLGLIQYAEADPTQTERIVDAMHRYVVLAHSMLRNNYTGLLNHEGDVFDTAGFVTGRTHEMHIPMQWLLERYPRNNSQIIWETMELMIEGGVVAGGDWRTFWTDEAYPEVYWETTPYDLSWVFLHGVNQAEGLRYTASLYRNTHDPALKAQTRKAVDLLAKYHRSLAGTILADEYISDLNPSRGAELCIAVEVMFSAAYLYQYLGDNDIADWVEQTAFNALPAQMSADWWSHQYVMQENQPWARNLSTDDLWWDVDSYANVFGLEPNYPCCLVNHPQGNPKFLANSFMTTEDGGLAHVMLIPGTAAARLGDDGANSVVVTASTTYPFGHSITYNISATSAFDFYVRIPTWADDDDDDDTNSISTTTTTIDGESTTTTTTRVSPDARGLHRIAAPAGASAAALRLATAPRVVPRANHTAAIYYGALLYALAIEADAAPRAPLRYRAQTPLPAGTTDPAGRARDYALTPRDGARWNVAIDPSQIEVVHTSVGDAAAADGGGGGGGDGRLKNPVWDLGAPPVELRVAATEIDWPVVRDAPADPGTFAVRPRGRPFAARFVPVASSKLHMALLPVVELGNGSEYQSED